MRYDLISINQEYRKMFYTNGQISFDKIENSNGYQFRYYSDGRITYDSNEGKPDLNELLNRNNKNVLNTKVSTNVGMTEFSSEIYVHDDRSKLKNFNDINYIFQKIYEFVKFKFKLDLELYYISKKHQKKITNSISGCLIKDEIFDDFNVRIFTYDKSDNIIRSIPIMDKLDDILYEVEKLIHDVIRKNIAINYNYLNRRTLILDSSVSSVLIHECIGHYFESDNFNPIIMEQFSNPLLNVYDDPTFNNEKKTYDDLGNVQKCATLISNGLPKSILSHQGNRVEMYKNFDRGWTSSYDKSILPRQTNLIVKKGHYKHDELIMLMHDGLYLTNARRGYLYHNGYVKVLCELAYEIKNCKVVKVYKNILISEHVNKIINSIKGIGDRSQLLNHICSKHGQIKLIGLCSPQLLIENVSVMSSEIYNRY